MLGTLFSGFFSHVQGFYQIFNRVCDSQQIKNYSYYLVILVTGFISWIFHCLPISSKDDWNDRS